MKSLLTKILAHPIGGTLATLAITALAQVATDAVSKAAAKKVT